LLQAQLSTHHQRVTAAHGGVGASLTASSRREQRRAPREERLAAGGGLPGAAATRCRWRAPGGQAARMDGFPLGRSGQGAAERGCDGGELPVAQTPPWRSSRISFFSFFYFFLTLLLQ
jgi:hypothetical protein